MTFKFQLIEHIYLNPYKQEQINQLLIERGFNKKITEEDKKKQEEEENNKKVVNQEQLAKTSAKVNNEQEEMKLEL